MIFCILVLVLTSACPLTGQNVSVNDAYMFLGETGTITCQIRNEGRELEYVEWYKSQGEDLGPRVYTYWPLGEIKTPENDLAGRSTDYIHVNNGRSTLIIHHVRATDQGNYTCQTDHGGKRTRDGGQVLVVARLQAPNISVENNPVIEAEEAVLHCVVNEEDDDEIQYEFQRADNSSINGSINHQNGTLTIKATHRNDEGNYRCRIRNLAGPSQWSADAFLYVDYPPEVIDISWNTNESLLYSGDNVTLSCRAKGGRPLASAVLLECLGQTSGSGTLFLDERVNSISLLVNKSWHGQKCSCNVTQRPPQQPHMTEVKLNISWPPTDPMISFSPKLPWLEDHNFTATCRAPDIGNPPCTFSWYKGNQSLIMEAVSPNVSMHVQKEDDKKVLECVLENQYTKNRPLGEVHDTANLSVQFAPRVFINPEDEDLGRKENDSVTLICSAESNPEAVNDNYNWSFIGVGMNTFRTGSKSWPITSLRREDAGTYVCSVVVNISHPEPQVLKGEQQKTLTVYYLEVESILSEQEVTEYETLSVGCTAEAVPDDVVFSTWIHDDGRQQRNLTSTTTNKTMAYMEFTNVQHYDAGTYTCRVGNSAYQEETAKQIVIVRYTAKALGQPSEGQPIFTGIGQSTSLSINVTAYPKNVTFTWYFILGENSTFLMREQATGDHLETTLNITNVTLLDFGNYSVHADNGVLKGSYFNYSVIQAEGPGKPSIDMEMSFSTPVSVEIWWRANHNGGYTQTFNVYYSELGGTFQLFRTGLADQGYNILHRSRIMSLNPETIYRIKVEALNAHNGESTASTEVEFKTLERPRTNNATMKLQRYGNRAFMTWATPEGVFDTQRVEQLEVNRINKRSDTYVCEPPKCLHSENLTVQVNSYNASGLDESKTYHFSLVLFYRGDLVQRQQFIREVETAVSEPSPTPPHLDLVVIASVSAAAGVVLIIAVIIIVVLLRRKSVSRAVKMDKSRNIPLVKVKENGQRGFDNDAFPHQSDSDNDNEATKHVAKSPVGIQNTSHPPPGSEGMMYATVEFMNQEDNVNKEEMPVKDSCEYADIDHTRKTGDPDNDVTGSAGTADVMATSVDESLPEYASVDYSKKKTKHSVKEKKQGPDDEVNGIRVGNGKENSKDVLSEEKPITCEGGSEYAVVDYSKKKRSSMKPSDKNLSSDDATHVESEDGNGKSDQSIII